jgi:hypothetical protein
MNQKQRFVHLPDTNQLSLSDSLVDAATGHGWADSQLSYRLRSKTGGMVWSHSRREDASSTGACMCLLQKPLGCRRFSSSFSLNRKMDIAFRFTCWGGGPPFLRC